MSDLAQLLSDHPFLIGLAEEHVARLATCCASLVTYDPGWVILREGEPADQCYLISEGDVALQLHAPGAGARTVTTLHGGDVLGWSWLFPPYRWSMDAVTLSRVSVVMIDASRLRAESEADSTFALAVTQRVAGVMAGRLNAARIQMLDLYAADD